MPQTKKDQVMINRLDNDYGPMFGTGQIKNKPDMSGIHEEGYEGLHCDFAEGKDETVLAIQHGPRFQFPDFSPKALKKLMADINNLQGVPMEPDLAQNREDYVGRAK